MTPEQIDITIKAVGGIIIAVTSAWSGYFFQKHKQLPSKPERNKDRRHAVTRVQCNEHKEVVDNVKQIPLVVQSLGQLKEQLNELSIDMKEIFRIIRTHEGQIQNLIGKTEK